MKLTKERQKETGAFYTPKIWADLAVEYMRNFVPNLEAFTFYDPAAGEGAILDALPANCTKIASTLEAEDVEILKAKGYLDAFQFDFLDGSLDIWDLHGDFGDIKPTRCLAKALMEPEKLIVFTNPPYVDLPASHLSYAKTKYKTNDATALFYYRIVKEIKPFLLCGFNKLNLLQSANSHKFRQELKFGERIQVIPKPIFLSPSKSWGLKGNFPIAFNMMLGFDIF